MTNRTLARSATDYDAISWGTGETQWGLDDVGLDRTAATANMVKRAIRHCEWQGVLLLENLLRGTIDPEQPQHIEETSEAPERWFCITPESVVPPLPQVDR